MRKATKDRRMGIQWTLTKQLEDLDFADDISLLAHRHEDAQTKIEHVADKAEKVGLQQSLEWQSPLYSVFVDFQRAFDSIDRETIWKLMQHYGIPPKFISI